MPFFYRTKLCNFTSSAEASLFLKTPSLISGQGVYLLAPSFSAPGGCPLIRSLFAISHSTLIGTRTFFKGQFFFFTKKHPLKNIHFSMYLDRPIFGSGAFGARKISKTSKMSFFSCLEKNLVPKKISLDVYGASPNSLGFSDSY